jgi:ankyrin repeat protein
MKEIVKLLLAKDQVDPDSKSSVSPASTGMTPLSYTAKSGHTAIVKLLLDTHGIDPFPEDSESYAAPLLLCAVWESTVDINSENPETGDTPLSWAASNGAFTAVKP